jgi:hypothetical protein
MADRMRSRLACHELVGQHESAAADHRRPPTPFSNRRKRMNVMTRFASILPLLPLAFGGSAVLAAPHHSSGGNGGASATPCAMTDFVGGAPYPQGMGPFTDISYPNTSESVTGRVYVQQATYSGIWAGDPYAGSIVKVELYVDGSIVATQDYTARKMNPLLWNATTKGTHDLMLRMYSTDVDRTRQCYLDSPHEFPLVI